MLQADVADDHERRKRYLRALRFRYLTRFYDRVAGVLLREEPLKRRLVDQVAMGARHRVLDVGCGTATLTLLAQRQVRDTLGVRGG